MKSILVFSLLSIVSLATLADPSVSGVSMSANDRRTYSITYSLSGAPAVVTLDVECREAGSEDDNAWQSVGVDFGVATGDVAQIVTKSSGQIQWYPTEHLTSDERGELELRAKVTAWPIDNPPDYMIVSLNTPDAPRCKYYEREDLLPWGGVLSNGAYRTTLLPMRKIIAKDIVFQMGATNQVGGQISSTVQPVFIDNFNVRVAAPHAATIVSNYYIAVFQTTQAQCYHAKAAHGSKYTIQGPMRPVDGQSWAFNHLRGMEKDVLTTPAPTADSVIGKFRSRTGLDLDLPTEAQWEFAMKAGYGDGYWPEGTPMAIARYAANSQDAYASASLDHLARYAHNGGADYKTSQNDNFSSLYANCGITNATTVVGSFPPNAWGIYDWGGNASEWCLDFWLQDVTELNGAPVLEVAAVNNYRVTKGRGPVSTGRSCEPSNRWGASSYGGYGGSWGDYHGFRLAAPCIAK